MQFLGLGGSRAPIPITMSVIHLTTCLVVLLLFIRRRVTIPVAFTIVSLVAQCTIVGRFTYFVNARPDNFIQLILINQMTSLMAVSFLVMCFVKITPFIVAGISLTAYGVVAFVLNERGLIGIYGFFISLELFLCILGEMLRRNVIHVQEENVSLHNRETAIMHAVRLNSREIEGYLRMSSNNNPTADDVDRFFGMLTPVSQGNIINAVRLHLKSHLMDDCDMSALFPDLTKTEVDVCNLILHDKKRKEICQILGKSEKNIDVVRTHVRKKLNVPADQDLKKYLTDYLVENGNIPLRGE